MTTNMTHGELLYYYNILQCRKLSSIKISHNQCQGVEQKIHSKMYDTVFMVEQKKSSEELSKALKCINLKQAEKKI